MTILFEPVDDVAHSLTFALQDHTPTHVRLLAALQRSLDENPLEQLVVMGPGVDLEFACEFAAQERMRRPGLGVVLVRKRVEATVLAQAIRAGIRDVVPQDDLSGLVEACNRSRELSKLLTGGAGSSASNRAPGVAVTVFSAKGGCGKTTMATNIAAALASDGRRRVCLVDLDLAFGDVGIALRLFPTRSITDVVGMANSIDETGVRSVVTPHSPGLDTVLAPAEPGDSERIPASTVAELLRALKGIYDVVVVDTPPSFTDHVLAALDQTDEFVLLATLDVPALKNLKLTLEMLDLLGYPRDRWHVLLNRSDSKVGLEMSDVEQTLKMPIAGQVPSSRAVSASVNRGVPLVLDQPNHPVSVAVRSFAEARLTRATRAGQAAPRVEKRALRFLRRSGATA